MNNYMLLSRYEAIVDAKVCDVGQILSFYHFITFTLRRFKVALKG